MVSLARRESKKRVLKPSVEPPLSIELNDNNEKDISMNVKPPPEFKCKRVGRFAHPSSCEKYYFCWDAVHDHAVFTCPYFEAFNPKTQRCEMDFAVCDIAPKCQFDLQMLPNPEDNSTYFECRITHSSDENESEDRNQYRLYMEHCGYRGLFDAKLGYCKLTAEHADDSLENDENDESKNKMECKDAGIFIDHSDESRYFECIVKNVTYTKIHQICPHRYVFSMADKRCIKLDTDEK